MTYLLALFAVFFLAYTAATQDGPFGVCAWVREKIDPEAKQDTWLRRGANCPICIGCYAALLVACLIPVAGVGEFLLNWLGLAGANAVLYLGVSRWLL